MNSFENVKYVWTVRNFMQQVGIVPGGQISSGKMAESPIFSVPGPGYEFNKWKGWVEANRIADQTISSPNSQDYFLTIRVRNQYLKSSSTGIYCKIEILTKDKKCVFTFLSQTTARGIYSNLTTFQCHRICNISELERQNPDLYSDGSLTIVLILGPVTSLQNAESELFTEQLARLHLQSMSKNTELLDPLKTMLDNGTLTDVVVRTREKDFPCHKVILAASSQVFRAMFESEMKESVNNVVDLRNVFDATTVKNVLYYMYTKQAPPDMAKNCLTLLSAADYFQLDLLKRLCVQTLCQTITVENAADILQLAEKYNIEVLQKVSVNFIVTHSKQVVLTPSWKSIPAQMTKYLLSTFLLAMADKQV